MVVSQGLLERARRPLDRARQVAVVDSIAAPDTAQAASLAICTCMPQTRVPSGRLIDDGRV